MEQFQFSPEHHSWKLNRNDKMNGLTDKKPQLITETWNVECITITMADQNHLQQ